MADMFHKMYEFITIINCFILLILYFFTILENSLIHVFKFGHQM